MISSRENFIEQISDELETGEIRRRAKPVSLLSGGPTPTLKAPSRPGRESDGLARGAASLNDHRMAIFAHEVANSLSAIGFSLDYFKSEFKARQIDDPVLNRTVHNAIAEVAGLGAFLHRYCTPPLAETLNYEVEDFARLVEDVLALQSLACLAAGVIVRFEREAAVLWVRLDAPKIKQVIANLCKNASEAMPEGGQLTVKVYRSGRSAMLEVADSGSGVAADVDVFELFKTTKRGGCGLGLPVTREIVAAHGGTIAYTSGLGGGTTFNVSLPVSEQQP